MLKTIKLTEFLLYNKKLELKKNRNVYGVVDIHAVVCFFCLSL